MPRRGKDSKSIAVAERPAAHREPALADAAARAAPPSPAAHRAMGKGAWKRRWKEFRFLAIILAAALALGFYETSRDDLPRTIAAVPPQWLMDDRLNMAQTLTELYPERSYGYFLRSYQASMCWEQGFAPPVCDIFPYKDLRDVRGALEEAIARGGSAEQESLFHFYAYVLARSDESPEVVEAAVRQWRRHYPHSQKPDPRQLAAASAAH